jgi:hypothetical protein
VTEIYVFIERGEKFKRRLEINWGDGGVSIVNRGEIILRGKDGNIYNVPKNSEHDLICRKVILENGYSIS